MATRWYPADPASRPRRTGAGLPRILRFMRALDHAHPTWQGSAGVYEALHAAAAAASLPVVAWSYFVGEVDRDHIDSTRAA